MKYWFYSEGNILGPYAAAELLSLPAFGPGSLVCPETSTGDNPGDWRAAERVSEIAEALSVGVGDALSSRAGGISGLYEPETGLSPAVGASYYETRNDQPYGCENLLNTIDNILGAYKESEAPATADPVPDYELADRFDIKLSKIQEELDAARWEKNLLLEKIRAKEAEERRNRELITELEGKLKGALDQTEFQEKELSRVQHLAELAARTETLKKIDELRKEDFTDRSRAPSSPAARPIGESRMLKSGHPGQEGSLERAFAAEREEKDNSAIASRKLRSLGHSPAPVILVGGEEHKENISAPACAQPRQVSGIVPPPVSVPEGPAIVGQAGGGVVYDVTTMTGQAAESEKVQFKIESKNEPAPEVEQFVRQPVVQPPAPQVEQPVRQPVVQPPAPQVEQPVRQPVVQPPAPQVEQPARQPVVQPPAPKAEQPAQPQNSWRPAQSQNAWPPAVSPDPAPRDADIFVPKPESAFDGGALARKAPAVQDKTEYSTISSQKKKEEVKQYVQPARKRGGRAAFLSTLIIFGALAAGGLCYFFLGDGLSFSEFSMLNFGGPGKSKKASFSTQVEPKADKDRAGSAAAEDLQASAAAQPASSASVKPAFEAASNENTRKALETVKGYKLSGGRGTVASWFANSFLSNSSSGSNEEWSATILHGEIFVVQYRLLRPKQDPLIYQFEVDVARNLIVRGINNNAIELLDFSSKVTARAGLAPKPRIRRAAPKARKSRGIPILPLPDEPAARPVQETPTGFETVSRASNEKVKYIMAQESDEELF